MSPDFPTAHSVGAVKNWVQSTCASRSKATGSISVPTAATYHHVGKSLLKALYAKQAIKKTGGLQKFGAWPVLEASLLIKVGRLLESAHLHSNMAARLGMVLTVRQVAELDQVIT